MMDSAGEMQHLDKAAAIIMDVYPEANVRFYDSSGVMGGRQGLGRTYTIKIDVARPYAPRIPEKGWTPFGWWLHRQYVTRIPRIKVCPGGAEIVWLGLQNTGIPFDAYIKRTICRLPMWIFRGRNDP